MNSRTVRAQLSSPPRLAWRPGSRRYRTRRVGTAGGSAR